MWLRDELVNDRRMSIPLATERVVAVRTLADDATVLGATAQRDGVRQSLGLSGVRVVDLRPR